MSLATDALEGVSPIQADDCTCIIQAFIDYDGTPGLTVHPDPDCESEIHQ